MMFWTRIRKEMFLAVIGIIIVVVMVNVLTLEPEIQPELIEGKDCQLEHGEYFLVFEVNYDQLPINSTNGTFSISFIPTSDELEFDASTELTQLPEGASLSSGTMKQTFTNFTGRRKALWSFTGVASARIPIEAKITFTVRVPEDYYVHPSYFGTYDAVLRFPLQAEEVSLIGFILSLRWFEINLFNQILAYLNYTFFVITVITGMPKMHQIMGGVLRRDVSASWLRGWHRKLGITTGVLTLLHVVISAISPMWINIIKLWPFPTLYLPSGQLRDPLSGLELGRWSGLLMLIIGVSGLDYNRLAKKLSRKYAISIQRLSYVILVLTLLHTLIIGTLTQELILFKIYSVSLFLLVVIIRLFVSIRNRKLKRERLRARGVNQNK
ncbi:MAG: hypothetical protein ACTSW1_00545 [Candidatus Hodarchaeales archaeon]